MYIYISTLTETQTYTKKERKNAMAVVGHGLYSVIVCSSILHEIGTELRSSSIRG